MFPWRKKLLYFSASPSRRSYFLKTIRGGKKVEVKTASNSENSGEKL